MPHDPTSRELAAPQLTNWRLLRGSHEAPGEDGGSCINEAAVVAAGLPYRKILDEQDCPPCFSRPLAAYALGLNDAMPDGERARLMAFVLRLSGSADRPEIEILRAEYIAIQTVKRILPAALRAAGLLAEADRCASVKTIDEATAAATAKWAAADAAQWAAAAADAAAAAADAAADAKWADAAAGAAAEAAEAAQWAAAAARSADTWSTAIAILDEALRIGRQAPEIDIAVASARLDAARAARETAGEIRAMPLPTDGGRDA